MNSYVIYYYSQRFGGYTYKIVKANSYEQAIKRARVKNIDDIKLLEDIKLV